MASTSSISGLVSGLDTSSIVSQLMQIEAQPQTLLKNRLSTTQQTAQAYRSVNTRFNALQSAADALTASGLAAAKTATSSSTAVAASADASAVTGSSITFTPLWPASTASAISTVSWSSKSEDITSSPPPQWPIEIYSGTTFVGRIPLKAGATLIDAAAAINASGYGLKATIVQVGESQFKLQVTSATSGEDGDFRLKDQTELAGGESVFAQTAFGRDAKIDLGGGQSATSSTNTFANLLPGVTVTLSPTDATGTTTVSVGSDPNSIATKVQALVDAANAALTEIANQTKITSSVTSGSTSTSANPLAGDYAVSTLAGQVLTAVSSAVGEDGSAAQLGIQTNRYGQLEFTKETFLAALAGDPDKVTRMLSGTPAKTSTTTVDGVPTTTTTPAVPGIAQRLSALAKAATDSTTGTLTLLADGQDSRAKDLQDQIADWDTRLATRQATLTNQFTAMETALSTLKNQSTWLSQQLNSLSTSSSK